MPYVMFSIPVVYHHVLIGPIGLLTYHIGFFWQNRGDNLRSRASIWENPNPTVVHFRLFGPMRLVCMCSAVPNTVSGMYSTSVLYHHCYCSPTLLLMVGKVKRSGSQKKRRVKIIDVEETEGRNRRGARVYINLEIPTESPSTSQRRTDGSKSPSKRTRSLSPEIDEDRADRLVPPYKRLKRKTKV